MITLNILPRPDRFLLGDLIDWMFEVMHKTPEDYNYERTDLRIDFKPLILAAILQYFPIGLRSMRAPTLDKLERVSFLKQRLYHKCNFLGGG